MIFLLLRGLTLARALTFLAARAAVEGCAKEGERMNPDATLAALVRAYVDGDRGARLALADWLEERGDPRAGAVRAAAVDWGAVARLIYRGRNPMPAHGRPQPEFYYEPEVNRIRWWIDCALLGSGVPADVADAVRQAHRRWLAELFPEVR